MSLIATRSDALRFRLAGVEITHLEAAMLTPGVPGIHVLFASARNGPGMGILQSTGDGSLVQWRAPGATSFGPPVNMSGGGDALLLDGGDEGKYLRVRATPAFFLPSTTRVLLADIHENAVSDTDRTSSPTLAILFGYAFNLVNDSAQTLRQIKVWLDAAAATNLVIQHSGSGDPFGVAITFPDLAASGSHTLAFQRLIPIAAPADPNLLVHLHASWRAF